MVIRNIKYLLKITPENLLTQWKTEKKKKKKDGMAGGYHGPITQ